MNSPFINENDFFKSSLLTDEGLLMKGRKALPIGTISTLANGQKIKKISDKKWQLIYDKDHPMKKRGRPSKNKPEEKQKKEKTENKNENELKTEKGFEYKIQKEKNGESFEIYVKSKKANVSEKIPRKFSDINDAIKLMNALPNYETENGRYDFKGKKPEDLIKESNKPISEKKEESKNLNNEEISQNEKEGIKADVNTLDKFTVEYLENKIKEIENDIKNTTNEKIRKNKIEVLKNTKYILKQKIERENKNKNLKKEEKEYSINDFKDVSEIKNEIKKINDSIPKNLRKNSKEYKKIKEEIDKKTNHLLELSDKMEIENILKKYPTMKDYRESNSEFFITWLEAKYPEKYKEWEERSNEIENKKWKEQKEKDEKEIKKYKSGYGLNNLTPKEFSKINFENDSLGPRKKYTGLFQDGIKNFIMTDGKIMLVIKPTKEEMEKYGTKQGRINTELQKSELKKDEKIPSYERVIPEYTDEKEINIKNFSNDIKELEKKWKKQLQETKGFVSIYLTLKDGIKEIDKKSLNKKLKYIFNDFPNKIFISNKDNNLSFEHQNILEKTKEFIKNYKNVTENDIYSFIRKPEFYGKNGSLIDMDLLKNGLNAIEKTRPNDTNFKFGFDEDGYKPIKISNGETTFVQMPMTKE